MCEVLLGGTATSATQWCFDPPKTGQEVCIPFLTEELLIKLSPHPGPLLPVDIREASF